MTESWKDLAKQLIWEMNPQDNYHGSPYTFNKFDDSKFLTGEGDMAHGAGHYSADASSVADRYTYDKSGIKTKNLYRVNVPNKNFMWQQGLPFEEQSSYIKNMLQNKYPSIFTDLKSSKTNSYLSNKKTQLIRNLFNKSRSDTAIRPIGDLFWDTSWNRIYKPHKEIYKIYSSNNLKNILMEVAPDISDIDEDMLKSLGIKGYRTVGYSDGPINVTFSGDNIKMANTPWQRFVNRIPKQTLGKMANKIIASPAFKSLVDVSPALGVGAEYLKPLDIIRSTGNNKKQKIQQMFNDAGYDIEVQPDGTYLFKM